MATTPTISDVARLAGVSVGTVSHVLRGKVRVSENLSQRVHEQLRHWDMLSTLLLKHSAWAIKISLVSGF